MADTSQSILRRLRDMYDNPRLYLEQVTDNLNNFNKGQMGDIRPSGVGMRNLTRDERVEQMVNGTLDNFGGAGMGGALGVIKGKGGNWLTGTVEGPLGELKRNISARARQMDRELIEAGMPRNQNIVRQEALNNWIEGPLTKYVKRDMATEGDPVRKLAEQGVLHWDPRGEITEGVLNRAANTRQATGNKVTGVAINPLAKAWETITDSSIGGAPASEWIAKANPEVLETMPWLSRLPGDEMVYERRNPSLIGSLNFQHLTDELANALNPESGLPRHLILTPEQMRQMGMEKAVRHVADINAWRAAQKAEADLARSQSPAVHLFKGYSENNPKGLRWVELKNPELDKLPEGYEFGKDTLGVSRVKGSNREYVLDEGEDPVDRIRKALLQDQLKYEGDVMGHCVGGYCDRVLGGEARIFSLRDAKGQPHVTIETRPGEDAERIIQIKGKQNLAPKEEYLPFVQDFVRSGKWADVGDIKNAGMRHTRDVWNDMERKRIIEAGHEIPDYMTREDIKALADKIWPGQYGDVNYAQGGLVKPDNYSGLIKQPTWRRVEQDGIIGYITE